MSEASSKNSFKENSKNAKIYLEESQRTWIEDEKS